MRCTKSAAVIGNEQKNESAAIEITGLLGNGRIGRVLDVGCGTGIVLSTLASRAESLCGIEPAPEFRAAAQRRLPTGSFVDSSIENRTSFDDGSFDTLIFCDVIEHLRRPVEALDECRRLLTFGGSLLVTTPNAASPIRIIRGERWFGTTDPTHVLLYTPFTLTHLMRAAGLEVERVATLGLTGNRLADAVLRATRSGGTLAVLARRTS